ncbi:chromosomal replication initiator protein DnaA [Streptococcus caprae]|uniref:Chromosomal replication initiator protein DnaA n=1 Tax=Streptococcus caprae TaxID=1640501 RepID=A0ABV8CV49_9STRE
MTNQEHAYWNRVLELAKSELKQAIYDFYVLDAQLVKIENQTATIFLDEVKQIFWDKNLKPILLMAGFEIYNQEIIPHYVSQLQETPITIESTQQGISNQPITKINDTVQLPRFDSNLNQKYRFDNFVQGDGNKWAFSAALAIADSPGTVYNPFFIWGGPGLGKTHLLNAIGNSILENNPNSRIVYLSAEDFINEFVTSIRLQKMEELKEKFRNLDVLLIDDIQSLAKGHLAATQEEFFNTFNALHSNQKQIVLTSDRTPTQLNDLEDRLVTRFSWGLTQDITPPDYETRIAIIQKKLEEYSFDFSQEAIQYLAGQFDSNVRELEGALKNISLIARTQNIDNISVDIVAQAIRARRHDTPKITIIPIEDIQAHVAKFYGVTVKEIKGTKRTQNIVLARQIAMFLTREMTDNSLPKIGKEFGGRDHSTVLHAYNKIKNAVLEDNNLRIEIETIKSNIR